MENVVNKILKWLGNIIPSVTAIGGWIYNYMLKRLRMEQNKTDKAKLEKELLENKIEVDKDNADKSDRDIVLDVANRNRE